MPQRPKPTALRLLEGSKPAPSIYAAEHEATPAPGRPSAPEGMADDVRKVWRYTVAQLDAMNLATRADRDILAAYCEAVVNTQKAAALVARDGILTQGLNGGLIRNPALVVQRDSILLMTRLAIEFGLTPAARTRINARAQEVVEDDNPFAADGKTGSDS